MLSQKEKPESKNKTGHVGLKEKGSSLKTKNIITHSHFHQDEAAAIALLRLFGESIFPGVKSARIGFLETEFKGAEPGTLYIGIGHGSSR